MEPYPPDALIQALADRLGTSVTVLEAIARGHLDAELYTAESNGAARPRGGLFPVAAQ